MARARREFKFGERAVSWMTVWAEAHPEPYEGPAFEQFHDDDAAVEMNHLRGLVMVQASETEAVLGMILRHLAPSADLQRPAGQLLKEVRKILGADAEDCWSYELRTIEQAIKRRNRVVHDCAHIGSVWQDYATDGGEWVPVISFLGAEQYDEHNLIDDVALQQNATEEAVHILYALERTSPESPTDSPVDIPQE